MSTATAPTRVQCVWLKRDLRLRDHAPLASAAKLGPVLCVYIFEPELMAQPDVDSSHVAFILECLDELATNLEAIGGRLTVRVGDAVEELDRLHRTYRFDTLWSHEETGNGWTYGRDKAVKRWSRRVGVAWREIPQHGVVRPLRDRDGWAAQWQARMDLPLTAVPDRMTPAVDASDPLPTLAGLNLPADPRTDRQRGGESLAQDVLDSFLSARGVNYRTDMSSPNTAWEGCSRLSPHLAYGTIAIREVYQRTAKRQDEVRRLKKRKDPDLEPGWGQSLSSFQGRLRWHCHFIQKLEDEPRIEFENMSRAYDGLRPEKPSAYKFNALREARTGYPMVDACVRALNATGWINFRMRSMLVSFACHDLWLHWRPVGLWLARLFLDYEPGIHWSQHQMQAGTTGINALRIYSPAKQVTDQDPRGVFIKRWIPELKNVPAEFLPEPHRMPSHVQKMLGVTIGKDYPAPIVDHQAASRRARQAIEAVRKTGSAKSQAQRVYKKHGSRRGPMRRRR